MQRNKKKNLREWEEKKNTSNQRERREGERKHPPRERAHTMANFGPCKVILMNPTKAHIYLSMYSDVQTASIYSCYRENSP